MNRPLRIALTKGRLEKDTVGLLEKIGYDCTAIREKGRKLILPVPDGNLEVVLAKANDVITYVEHGVCDMGVVGKDTIMEMQGKFFELVDTGFGRCKFALATKKGSKFYGGFDVKTVATKYPNITRRFFEAKGMDVDIIKIEGSVELAPLLELADGIVDIVETGTTLKENGLEVIEDVCPISARLIVNMVSMKMRQQEIEKAVHMADMMKVPVLGIVENMSYFECPDCGKKHNIYGESHVDEAAVKFGIDAVAKMPIDPKFAKACDNGEIEEVEGGWLDSIADKLLG